MSSLKAAFVVAVVLAAVVSPVVLADPPEQSPLPPISPTVFVGACSFPVLLEQVAGKEVLRNFSSGNSIVTGKLIVRLTNTTTDRSLVVNVSGPSFFRLNKDGSASFTLAGRSLLIGNAEMLTPLEGQATLQSGKIVFTFNPSTGEFISADFIGNSRDLCAALA